MRRRRRPLTVWPAVADLMTVLAVLGLLAALALIPAARDNQEVLAELRVCRTENREQATQLAELRQQCREDQKECDEKIREAARNEWMFEATQRVQQIIDEISADGQLDFGRDQTLTFGDDLVEYDINSTRPQFKKDGRERLWQFCTTLTKKINERSTADLDLRQLFTVEVQGHTDNTQCPTDPHCNWWVSASRAAHFVALMHDPSICPGGNQFTLKATGLADTQPSSIRGNATTPAKRIAINFIPTYKRIEKKS